MHHLIVNKIGGSILKSPSQLKNTVAAIQKQKARSIIVVSALFGVTDQLILATKANSTESVKKIIGNIQIRHLQWLSEAPFTSNTSHTIAQLNSLFDTVPIKIEEYRATKEPHTFAAILSTGEKLSSLILTHYFNDQVHIYFPENIHLKVNNSALNGDYSADEKLTPILTNHTPKISVVSGFYGINDEGQHCLVGRGGSDYTAAFIARHINAQELIFWKDSNGIQTANPKLVENALNVTHINLQTLETMANLGSEILHSKVTDELRSYNGLVSFRNPAYGNRILTHIYGEKSTSGKAIIVEKELESTQSICQISVITRNITATLINIQQLKNRTNGLKIVAINSNYVSFKIKSTDKKLAISHLHKLFHENDIISNYQPELLNTNH